MNEIFFQVRCPECHATFKARLSDIPDKGAWAVCKKCGYRFTVRKPAESPGFFTLGSDGPRGTDPCAPKGTALTPATAERRQDALFTCPKCGHRQVQPFTCYSCGAVITPREPAPNTAPGSPISADLKTPAMELLHGKEMGEIIVRTRFRPLLWFLNLTRPCIHIDEMEYHREWGVQKFWVLNGDCKITIGYRWFLGSNARSSINVRISNVEKTFIDYFVKTPRVSVPGNIRIASLAEGIGWQIQAGSARPPGKSNSARKGVIVSLILLGPIGLFPLWKSDQFSKNTKMIITAAMVLITLLILTKI